MELLLGHPSQRASSLVHFIQVPGLTRFELKQVVVGAGKVGGLRGFVLNAIPQ